jgi:hypothetical protein
MSSNKSNEITILSDSIERHYSLGCENCGTTTTHKCFKDTYTEHIRYGHLFTITRDRSDSVFAASCTICGMRDVSPFIEDCIESLEQHADFHDYAIDELQVDLKYTHGLDIFLMEADFIDSLDELKITKEDLRFDRCCAWGRHFPEEID